MANEDYTDDELLEIIKESLDGDDRIDKQFIEIEVVNGKPVISGRVSSDDQLEALEENLAELSDISAYENNVWVDDELAFETNEDDRPAGSVEFDEDEEGLDSDEEYIEEDSSDDD